MSNENRNWKTVSRKYNKIHDFEIDGLTLEGRLLNVRKISTEYGTAEVADILKEDTSPAEEVSIIISSGMQTLKDVPVNTYVRIEYCGFELNPKTKRRYKSFVVQFDDTEKIPEI